MIGASTIAILAMDQRKVVRRKQNPKRKIGDQAMSIPKMMKAAVVDKFREPLSIREVSVPAPLPGEVLVEIHVGD
jgi:hypothetical protein